MVLRVTRVAAQVGGAVTDADLRITRSVALVAGNTGSSSTLQVSQIRLQIATTSTSQPKAFTSELGTNMSSMGNGTMELGAPPEFTTILAGAVVRTASNTLAFTQLGATAAVEVTAGNSLSFTQTNFVSGIRSVTASDSLTLTQSGSRVAVGNLTASNTLALTQTNSPGVLSRSASNSISFTQTSGPAETVELTASDSLSFTQSSSPGLLSRSASQSVAFTQFASGGFASVTATQLTASHTLTFTQSGTRVHAFAAGISLTASHTLTLTQRAIFPIGLTATHTLALTQSSSGNAGKSGTQTLDLTQTVVANHFQSLTASNTLSLAHAFTFAQFRDGIPIAPNTPGTCGITRQYSPLSGGDGTPLVAPNVPALNRQTDVFFYFPSTSNCDPTDSITLRTPNFGDRDRNQYNRINRESRGGSLTIFRDPQWPSQRTLVMDFSNIKDAQIDGLLSFLETTLGQKVGFRDWAGRQWSGIITSPDATIVRNGTDRNDIALELEVDAQEFDYQICSTLTLTQSADVELIPV